MDPWTKELAKREPEAAQIIVECEAENARLRAALRNLLACCEKHPAFQKPSNLITTGRVAAARAALGVQ